jgi:hypothetical protein
MPNTYNQLSFHVVFSTKNRQRTLPGVNPVVPLRGTAKAHESDPRGFRCASPAAIKGSGNKDAASIDGTIPLRLPPGSMLCL